MPQLIKNQNPAVDAWKTLEIAEGETPESIALPGGDVIYPLAVWRARRDEIRAAGGRIGVLVQPDEKVEDLAADLGEIAVVAIHFPKFVDGRGYSSAALLRQRHGYRGEIRAVGNVLHDQLFYMQRVGFDSFLLADGKSPEYAVATGFSTFSDVYQAATDQPQPLFRRRSA